ncbi:DNA-binding MarR family transcriptional regulator [Variovorax paradoxus]|uniref:MarR family winged helix-turn-helix transcriptional regulator n=1 Tax=Variovorax paradoxus TaxID=34073 RepID=UPI002788E234|nr:MarR family winged helix-turn-helix transcriptional regulator [Variovorax paradoxus]MDP9928255.1 DNA-binding MarR family transcriptional regulator [Variovorax paradoxus]MDQ0024893.1 DNA-binding MarR family transcriptional regulator [Variovorax paradoxus]
MRNSPTPGKGARVDEGWRTDNVGRLLSSALRRFEERVMSLMVERGHAQTRRSHVNLTRHLDIGGTRITELARRAAMTNAAMTELIDQCESIGLVERMADPADKRVRIVRFTQVGESWLKDFGRAVAQAQREMSKEVGEDQLAVVLAALASYAGTGGEP